MSKRENALALNLQGLCDLLEGIKPHIDAMPERKRRMVPGAAWIDKAVANARQVLAMPDMVDCQACGRTVRQDAATTDDFGATWTCDQCDDQSDRM